MLCINYIAISLFLILQLVYSCRNELFQLNCKRTLNPEVIGAISYEANCSILGIRYK